MKSIFIYSIILMFCGSVILKAQNNLTLEDVISGGKNYDQFIPENPNYSFKGATDTLVLIIRDSLFVIDKDLNKQLLFSIGDVNKVLTSSESGRINSLKGLKWINNYLIQFNNGSSIIVFDSSQKILSYSISVPNGAEILKFNSKVKALVYLFENNLYLARHNQKPILIEQAKEADVVLGQSVHRNEFGISEGIFWSPEGNKIAFYCMDESMVEDYPLVNINTRIAKVENIKYPMAGLKSHQVSIGIYDILNSDLKYLKTGTPNDKYLTNVSWSPDEEFVFVAELNRGQNHMSFKMYDSHNGSCIKTLFEEKSDQWVEPENPISFIPGSTSQFIWQSERDGFNHLYLYDLKEGLQKQLTKGNWVVTKFDGFSGNTKKIFFEATKDGELNNNFYSVFINNGKIKRITQEDGYHNCKISKTGNFFIDNYSSVHLPRKTEFFDLNRKEISLLHTSKNPFADYDIGEVKLGKLKASDGLTDLNYRMVLPVDFTPEKKYPVIVYVYGGPHAQLVKNNWLGGARLWQFYMSQQGYISFTMDNRGTPNRGCEFEKVIHRRLGEIESADQFEGVKFLKSLPYVDIDRIGVHGWSFGGFMTINLMEKYPEVFKVGVSGGPVTDWKYYEIMYGERYMDTPEENPEGYRITNVNERVGNIKGKLLVIHGAIDPTVVWQHSLVFTEQCIKNRIQTDYFVYPRHEHNVLGPDRVHLMKKVTQYFNDFL